KFSITKASQAFCAYRFRFMDHKIYIHNDVTVQNLERSAYIGGRVECFRLGKIPGKQFVSMDINSMYPFVMKAEKYPYELVSY
ncbi:unnamed protein product, partial [marine sediment metagenome]